MSSEKCTASTFGSACAATEVTKIRKPAAASKLSSRRARRIAQLWHGEGGCRVHTLACMQAPFGREDIESILPHREPFLLLDEVLEFEAGKRVVARRRVREDEWYFKGHFPGRPVMPGVLIVEAMAQTGAVAVLAQEENRGKIAYFAGIDDCRFKRIVEPGDELELVCELDRVRGPIGRGKAEARVGGELAARATLTFAVER